MFLLQVGTFADFTTLATPYCLATGTSSFSSFYHFFSIVSINLSNFVCCSSMLILLFNPTTIGLIITLYSFQITYSSSISAQVFFVHIPLCSRSGRPHDLHASLCWFATKHCWLCKLCSISRKHNV